jgi:glucose-1-phosphate cytidylyltransferase
MKVVLFCGGLGMRLHPTTENVPKPLVLVGDRSILSRIIRGK